MSTDDAGGPELPQPAPAPPGRRVDMTSGSLLPKVAMLSWPIIGAYLLQVAVGIADTKMVGSLGPVELAAVGTANGVMFFFVSISFAVSMGVQILVAQYTGRGDTQSTEQVLKQGIMAAVAITLLIVSPWGVLLSSWIMKLMGADVEMVRHGAPYLQLMFGGMLFLILSFVITGALQGAGDTLTPLMILLVANAINILCNYVFIFGVGPFPALGVQGAAVGTLVSRVLSAGAGLWVLASGRFALVLHWRRSWQVRWNTVGRILALGFPASLQGVTRNFGFMVMIKVLALTTAGTYAIAAYTVSMQIRMLTTMVGLALMAAATTAVGQNVGARNIERAGKSAWIIVALAAGISTISGIIYATFGGYFTGLFNDHTQVVAIGAQALLWLALSEPFLTAGMVLSGALRGAGDTISPLIISIISITIVGPLVAYVLAITFGMGTLGVWLGINIGIWLRIVLLVWQFQRSNWKRLPVR